MRFCQTRLYSGPYFIAFYANLQMSNITPIVPDSLIVLNIFSGKMSYFHHPVPTLSLSGPRPSKITKFTISPNSRGWECLALSSPSTEDIVDFQTVATTFTFICEQISPYAQMIDTYIRDPLKIILRTLNISTIGHLFHIFRRSGATLDHNISLQNIIASVEWSHAFGASHFISKWQ